MPEPGVFAIALSNTSVAVVKRSGGRICTRCSPSPTRRLDCNGKHAATQYPLPQPPQDPITVLTGRGHYTITGDCPFDSDFESRVERSGD
jgi:hypothetical protein